MPTLGRQGEPTCNLQSLSPLKLLCVKNLLNPLGILLSHLLGELGLEFVIVQQIII